MLLSQKKTAQDSILRGKSLERGLKPFSPPSTCYFTPGKKMSTLFQPILSMSEACQTLWHDLRRMANTYAHAYTVHEIGPSRNRAVRFTNELLAFCSKLE